MANTTAPTQSTTSNITEFLQPQQNHILIGICGNKMYGVTIASVAHVPAVEFEVFHTITSKTARKHLFKTLLSKYPNRLVQMPSIEYKLPSEGFYIDKSGNVQGNAVGCFGYEYRT